MTSILSKAIPDHLVPSLVRSNDNRKHPCRCPACSDDPAYTYTPEYQFECLARTYGHMNPDSREKFVEQVRRKRRDASLYLARLDAAITRLKSESRYETDFFLTRNPNDLGKCA